MDPVSIIGLGAAVIGTTDVVTRAIASLRRLQQQWKSADMTVGLLVSQLTALKAALSQISCWIDQSFEGEIQYHQLVMDLQLSVQSCTFLVSLMDGRLSELNFDETNCLVFESRAKAVLQDGQIKECVSHLNNQSTALNLLLTALNCRTLSEQKNLLESDQSRHIFDQVKDDSSSLIVLRDSSSISSSWATSTARSSIVNQAFDFDGEIMKSKVYQGQMRSLLKRLVQTRRPQSQLQRLKPLYFTDMYIENPEEGLMQGPLSVLIDSNTEHSLINLTITDLLNLDTSFVSPQGEGDAKLKPIKYVRPRWAFSGEQNRVNHFNTEFRVVNHISYGELFPDVVLGDDYCKEARTASSIFWGHKS